MEPGTNLVNFTLRRTGSSVLLTAEPAPGGPQAFAMHGVQLLRFRHEGEVLKIFERAGIGRWSSFPPDHIQATVSRGQLHGMGFRGNY